MTPKLLGVPNQLPTKPLTHSLRENATFQLIEDTRPNIAKQLHEQELSAALISPLDYAKDSSDYCIVPNVAVVSPVGDSSIVVRFREGVKRIATLAVDPTFAFEIILAKIILAESFDIEPTIVPMIAPLDVMLQKADAALIAGDLAFRTFGESENMIDLIEEWYEMTSLPFVHALWCGRDGDLTKEDLLQLQSSTTNIAETVDAIAQQIPISERIEAQRYLESFTYELNDAARDGLAEFMKYLYYHGILPDVAELNFFSTDDEKKDDLFSDISAN